MFSQHILTSPEVQEEEQSITSHFRDANRNKQGDLNALAR